MQKKKLSSKASLDEISTELKSARAVLVQAKDEVKTNAFLAGTTGGAIK